MKQILLICMLALSTTLLAQKPVEFKLWQDNEEATLTVYPAARPNGQAIVACPGGAYCFLAMNHEGHDMAAWMNAQGITYAVLKYRLPNGQHDVPLSDVHQAMRLMREHATEWKFQKVGIMGSSAGGHLASTAATHYTTDTRPDFQILFYPVVSMDTSITHKDSRANLLGQNPSEELDNLYSNEKQVTADTPPAFIMHCSDDTCVPVQNSVNYYLALTQNHVPASLHIYPTGEHGWGFGDHFSYKRQWTGELEKWLRELR